MAIAANFPSIKPSLNLDFANVGRLDPRVTFTRASTATYYDQLGVLQSAANDTPRFDYNPSTLAAQGLLIEEQRTNSIRNNTMQGAAAGTPGTLPTNWGVSGLGTLTQEIVGTGTEGGISYIDVRFSGTTSSGSLGVRFETNTGVAASSGQVWTASIYARLVAGTTTNVNSVGINLSGLTAAAAVTTDTATTNYGAGIISSNLATNRATVSRTLSDANTAFLRPQVLLGLVSGAAIDITLRIGLPQLEQGAFATSVIPTTTTALTRSADAASMTGTNFSSWYSAGEGTLFVQALRGSDVDATIATIAIGSTTTDRIQIHSTTASEYRATYRTGNVEQAALVLSFSTNSPKIAATIKANDLAASINGASPQTDTSAALAAYDTFYIGARSDSSVYWNSHIQRIAYYPSRLTDAQLQALTA